MVVDSEMASSQSEERRNAPQWETGLHRGLTRLDISNTPPHDRDGAGTWANETEHAVQAQGEQARANPPTVRFHEPPPSYVPSSRRTPPRAYHQHTFSAPPIGTSRENKRHGWYHGPPHGHEQGDGSADPRSRVERMVHPNVAAFAGFPAREGNAQEQGGNSNPEALKRLEALVAVATSEGKTATAY